jgi:glycosyltransferase involved in cell wall biosynthesis
MEKLAEELEITKFVTFHGMQSDVYPYLHEADIFVLPSIYEGMPMTIIEAMATGLPIVATRVGGVPDMVEDGVSALLVPCETEAICAACERLATDTSLRERLGKAAMDRSPVFSAAQMAKAYSSLYSQT